MVRLSQRKAQYIYYINIFYTAEVNTDIGHFSVTQVTNSRLSVVNLALQTLETLAYQMKNDPRSCASNICNCVRSLKKTIGTSTGFEPVTLR